MTVSLRGLRLGLIVSVALNAFLIALAATLLWRAGDGQGPPRGGLMPSPRRLIAQLDEADRPKLQALIRERRATMRAEIRALVDARAALAQALRAEPYDRAAASAAFAALRGRADAVSAYAHESVLLLADQLDAKGRARLADVIEAEHRHWRALRRHRARHGDAALPGDAPASAPADAPRRD